MRLCVIVPTYNERENVGKIISSVSELRKEIDVELLFVDDSSPDGTAEIIRDYSVKESWVRLLLRESKKGIGSAYLDAIRHVAQDNYDYFATMDADLQHPVEKLREMVSNASGSCVVIASRYVKGGKIEGWSTRRKVVSKLANMIATKMLSLNVKDATSGFRVYSRDAIKYLARANLKANGFEFQVISLNRLKDKFSFIEIPYTFKERSKGRSKLSVPDIIRFLFAVVWEAL